MPLPFRPPRFYTHFASYVCEAPIRGRRYARLAIFRMPGGAAAPSSLPNLPSLPADDATRASHPEATSKLCADASELKPALEEFEWAFGQAFTVVNAETGELVYGAPSGLFFDLYDRLPLLAEVARRGKPEIVEDESPLMLLAAPLGALGKGLPLVAVALFVQQQVNKVEEAASAAKLFGLDAERTLRWIQQMEVWSPRVLMRLAEATLQSLAQRRQVSILRNEASQAIAHARETYVELGLLHRVTRHLHIAEDEAKLWGNVLGWLADAVPAQCLAVVANRAAADAFALQVGTPNGILLKGECPVDPDALSQFPHRLGPEPAKRTLVFNRAETSLPTWGYPTVRELICVPMEQGGRALGWLLALNHTGDDSGQICEFGSVETRLLDSIGTIFSIHSSNLDRFRKSADLFASSVRAMTTAIDAKDRYTSGHSDRVARISVCLGERLGLSKKDLDTIYLGGLLHDIGKIGIDDNVLNKPGALTKEEFDHIKQHPQFGYDILKGVQQLDAILPVVLHHHESWDGSGYPHGLTGPETPLLARIVAVADAFDAMGSDRPYRKGMPSEKLDQILRDGAGQQWDAEVVDAFFAARDQITIIAGSETSPEPRSLDATRWVD